MNLLVFNCGSSSQGFTVFEVKEKQEPRQIFSGKARNVATQTRASATLEWKGDAGLEKIPAEFPTHRTAAEAIISLLVEKNIPIDLIGHRFVHGGTYFSRAARLDEKNRPLLEKCLPLAPIHNPNSYSVIRVCDEKLPAVPQYVVFDTAFHSELPPEAAAYAIPQDIAREHGWRQTGFHGLSYQYISQRAAELTGRPLKDLKLILCHLGTGGSSVCAMKDGHSVDTSMGYSPTSGLVMSTRCGDIDPEIVLDMIREGMSAEEVSELLNRRSGLVGLSGFSSNLNEIITAAKNGDRACELTFRVYAHRLRKYIGAFLYELNGADMLVFADDIGQNCPKLRKAVCENAQSFGLFLDEAANERCSGKEEALISRADSPVQIRVIPTDEELTICREIMALREKTK